MSERFVTFERTRFPATVARPPRPRSPGRSPTYPSLRYLLTALGLNLAFSGAFGAEEPAGDEVVKMEPFNVTAYGGKMPVIDGFTGKDYKGNNDVVFNFAASFNKLLIGYHKKLVTDEIKHLQFIYDPFSWVARRETRFRGGFINDCLEHIQAQRIYVDDRGWFDPVFSRFLSDVITIKLQGAQEIYSLHLVNKRLGESPRALGLGLDLLNWNKGEKREAIDKPETEARISTAGSGGFRYVLIDAYQRFGDALLEKIRARLQAQKEQSKKINGQAMLAQIVAELSGMSYDEFARRAKVAQEAELAKHRVSRTVSRPPAAAGAVKEGS